ncbi:hypothetical protein COCON_G00187760 [Conger conger]|uniref:Galectin domain-containing protein n=1 Tax=Conger conger TaxID=82655 RepID=A0A9Q1HRM9_CONCO|nr:hypothetical protein COCON_G00187760 [Conger conger]
MHFEPPPGYQSIANPGLPYTGAIYGGLRPGMSLYFQGTVHKDATRFWINLQEGQVGDVSIAFHFNPRFSPSAHVVMNSRVGNWGGEETPGESAIQQGEDFQLLFIVTSEGYQIKINSSDYHLFKHRMPVEEVDAIDIMGDFDLNLMNIIGGGKGFIQGYPGLGQMMSIPYVGSIYGGLRKGMSVHIQGAVPSDATRFHISLQCAEAKCSNKALYINPRFIPAEVVVFNSFMERKFEEQERPTDMPLELGESFDIVIVVKEEGYQVNVNGREFYMFKHRMPVERVLAVAIGGDVYVGSVNVTGGNEGAIQAWPAQGYVGKNTYTQPIPGGLKAGTSLYFRGSLPTHNSNRFHLNLQAGDDLALHFNPRIQSRIVALNSSLNNGWGKQENVEEFPFRKGDPFELVFFVTSEGYELCVDGRQIYLYKHRVSPELVTGILIAQDVSVQAMNIIRDQEDTTAPPAPEDGEEGHVIEFPAPGDVSAGAASLNIDGGLKPGMSLYFEGTVHTETKRFTINLESGDDDILLHFNPRFEPDILVMNTKANGWQKDEKEDCPFQRGKDFQLLIKVTSEAYEIIVNGSNVYTYKHRVPVEQVTHIRICEGVTMQTVKIFKEQGIIKVYPGPGNVKDGGHSQDIDGGLRPGMSLCLQGTAPEGNPDRFNINLMSGDDIVLHFKVYYRFGLVVFNTKVGGWQLEERVGDQPLQAGRNFDLIFNVTLKGYQVIINERPFYLYKHRMAADSVTTMCIGGDVSFHAINIIRDSTGGEETGYNWRFLPMLSTQPTYNPSIPFSTMIPEGMSLKKTMVFGGRVLSGADRFAFDFIASSTGDRVFHFNPRLKENSVVRNSYIRKSWGSEERDVKSNPFREGECFEVVIRCGRLKFEVFANGKHMFDFYHLFQPFTEIDSLTISGDVQLFYVLI